MNFTVFVHLFFIIASFIFVHLINLVDSTVPSSMLRPHFKHDSSIQQFSFIFKVLQFVHFKIRTDGTRYNLQLKIDSIFKEFVNGKHNSNLAMCWLINEAHAGCILVVKNFRAAIWYYVVCFSRMLNWSFLSRNTFSAYHKQNGLNQRSHVSVDLYRHENISRFNLR